MEIKCAYTELVDLEKLTPNPRNDNEHKPEHVDLLCKVLKSNGVRHPIIVSKRSGFIVAGHLRLMAASKLDMKSFPVDYQDFETEADEYRFLSSDNNVARYAELDDEKMLFNLKELDIELDAFDFSEIGLLNFELPQVDVIGECDEDAVPEIKHEPATVRGDVWLLGSHRVMCGDSTMIDDVDKLMNGGKVDMVFTDPPYGGDVMGKAGGKDSGFNRSVNKIKDAVEFISNFDPTEFLQTLEYLSPKSYYICTNLNLLKQYLTGKSKLLVWAKGHGMPSVGNYNSDIEFIVYTKNEGAIFNKGLDGVSYLRLISMPKKDRDLHPTMKPIKLIENCLLVSSNKNSCVVDFFLGSGSTLIACEKTNRKCYGMELDPIYVDVIVQRYVNYTGNKNIFLNGESYVWETKQ